MDDRRVCACCVYGPYLYLGYDCHHPDLYGARAFHACPSIPAWKTATWISVTQLVCLLAMTAFFFAGGHMWLTWVECGFVGLDFESYCSLCQSIVLGFIALDYLATWLITHGAGLQTLRRSLFWKISVIPGPWFHLWAVRQFWNLYMEGTSLRWVLVRLFFITAMLYVYGRFLSKQLTTTMHSDQVLSHSFKYGLIKYHMIICYFMYIAGNPRWECKFLSCPICVLFCNILSNEDFVASGYSWLIVG